MRMRIVAGMGFALVLGLNACSDADETTKQVEEASPKPKTDPVPKGKGTARPGAVPTQKGPAAGSLPTPAPGKVTFQPGALTGCDAAATNGVVEVETLPFIADRKYGFMKKTGEILVPAKHGDATFCRGGVCVAQDLAADGKGTTTVYDKAGQKLFDTDKRVDILGSGDSRFPFRTVPGVDGSDGYLDATGAVVIAPSYSSSERFTAGAALVSSSDSWIINPAGVAVSSQHDRMARLSPNLFLASTSQRSFSLLPWSDGVVGSPVPIAFAGAAPQDPDSVKWGEESFVVASPGRTYSDPTSYSFHGPDGSVLFEGKFGSAHAFSSGLAGVCTGTTSPSCGYKNKSGVQVIPAVFTEVNPFVGCFALVNASDSPRRKVIDRTGKDVLVFSDGLSGNLGGIFYHHQLGRVLRYWDAQGNEIVPR